jgi:hypothetical protein
MPKIGTLEKNGSMFYPATIGHAIALDSGETLEEKLTRTGNIDVIVGISFNDATGDISIQTTKLQ